MANLASGGHVRDDANGGLLVTGLIDRYLDPAGSDAADGLTPATAWATLAKAQAALPAGKMLGLKRGGRWAGSLAIPSNGVRVVAYGASETRDGDGYPTNAPVIDGGTFVTGWTPYTGGAEVREIVDDFTGVAGTNLTAHVPNVGIGWAKTTGDAFANDNIVISGAGRARRSAVNAKAKYAASPILGGDDYYIFADVFVASVDTDFCEVIARGFSYTDKGYWVRLSGASGALTLGNRVAGVNTNAPAGAFTTVAAALGAYTVGSTYRLQIEVNGSTITGKIGPVGGPMTVFNTWVDTTIVEGDQVMLQLGSAASVLGDDTHGLHVDHLEQGPLGVTGSPVNTYQAASSPQVYTVDMGGTLRIKGPNVDQLAEGQFFWQANKLYVRRNAGQPSNTDVIRGSVSFGIDVAARTGVVIDGIAFEHQAQRAITSVAGATGLTVRGCGVQLGCNAEQGNNGCIGILAAGSKVQGNRIRNVNNDGVYYSFAAAGTAPELTDNVIGPVSGFGADGAQVDAPDGAAIGGYYARNRFLMTDPNTPKGGLILFGDSHTVEDNYFEGAGVSIGTGAYGVSLAGNDMVLRRNVFYNVGNDAWRASANNVVTRTGHVYHHNVAIDCGQGFHGGLPGTGFLVYANTFVNVLRSPQFAGVADYIVAFYDTITGEFKDNIIWDASGAGRALSLNNTSASFLRDFNLIGPEAAAFVREAGVNYATLAAYVAARVQDVHSLAADPLFLKQGGVRAADYTLRAGSPARGGGVLLPGYVDLPNIGAL